MSGDVASLNPCRWNHQYQEKTFYFGDNLIFFGGGKHTDGRTEECTDRGGSHVNLSPVIFQYIAMGYRFRCPNSISWRWGPGSTLDDLLASYVTTTDGSDLFFLSFFLKAQSLRKLVKVIFGIDSFPLSQG